MTRQMADDEVLRPCPFCGGEPVLEAEVIHFPGKPRNKFFAVKCVSENCPASNIAQDGEMGGFICSWRKEKAIAAWNDQRSVAALQAERDADKAALEALRGQVAGLAGGLRTQADRAEQRSEQKFAEGVVDIAAQESGCAMTARHCAAHLDALLAIKERMG